MKIGFAIPTLTAYPRSVEKTRADTKLRFERSYELCDLAEELGFDFGSVGHHRFSPWTVDSSCPLVLLAALAARTSRLRLLTNILLLATHNPVEIAEQAGMVDEISDGRLILGIGLGYRPYEYEKLGLSFKERSSRLEEGIAILRQALGGKAVTFHGRHYDVEGADVTPRPIQPNGPPIWVGAIAPPAVLRAARLGDGWIASGTRSIALLIPQIQAYRAAAREAGMPGSLTLFRKIGIGATHADIVRNWLPSVVEVHRQYARDNVPFENPEFEAKVRSGADLSLDDLPRDQFIIGTPEECIAQLCQCRELTGCDNMIADFGRAAQGEEFTRIRAAMDLFGREVLPNLGGQA